MSKISTSINDDKNVSKLIISEGIKKIEDKK